MNHQNKWNYSNNLIRHSGIIVPNDYPGIDLIKQNLTKNVQNWDDSFSELKFYEKYNEDSIVIPRFYNMSNANIEDTVNDGDDIDIEMNSKYSPKEGQVESINKLLEIDNGVLQMETGRGKTFCAIYTIAKIKKRSIIFVHKDSLIKNWQEEILEYTNLDKKQIGRLNSKNFKKCFKKSIILCTPHVISYAVKNNKIEFLNELKESNIGIMFIDESHSGVGPEAFSRASLFTPAKKVFGLSATPYRTDGLNDIIKHHLGDIFYYPPKDGELLKPKINIIKWDHGIYSNSKRFINFNGRFSMDKYCSQMKKSDNFNKVVIPLLKKLYNDKRIILILGSYINPMIELAKKLNLPKSEIGIFMPTAKKDKIKTVSDEFNGINAFKTKPIVFSTYGAARDGNNRKDLDALVMLNTNKNVIQAVGRILRTNHNKNQPKVFDFVDIDSSLPLIWNSDRSEKIPKFEKHMYDRIKIYEEKEWEYKFIYPKV